MNDVKEVLHTFIASERGPLIRFRPLCEHKEFANI